MKTARSSRQGKRKPSAANAANKAAMAASKVAETPEAVLPGSETLDLRESLKSLVQLGGKMHRAGTFKQPIRGIRTEKDAGLTTDHIWGQMNMLAMPVLREVGDTLDHVASVASGAAPADGRKGSKAAAGGSLADRMAAAKQKEKQATAAAAARNAKTFDETEFEEDLDRELAAVDEDLVKLRRTAKSNSGKAGKSGGDGDDWRYAFGKADDSEDEDEEADEENDAELERLKKLAEEHGEEGGYEDVDEEDDGEGFGEGDDEEGEEDMFDGEGDGEESEFGDDAEQNLEQDFFNMEDADEGELNEDDMNDEDRAVMAELYGDGAEDDEDDNEDPFMGGGALGKTGRVKKRKITFEGEDFEDEEADDYEDDDFDGDLASREGSHDDLAEFGSKLSSSKQGPAGGESDEEDDDPSLTEYERTERRRLREVRRMEEERVYNDDWTMKGEVSAAKRPRDSLLEEVVDFEHAMNTAPVVTQTMTAKLEDRIKLRIQNDHFDDVVRRSKISSADDIAASALKKDTSLDAEKSKLSLMDLYEKEYTEKMKAAEKAAGGPEAAEPLTEVERDELKAVQMWKRLSQHLDALSNFFYTPKPAQADLEARVRAVSDAAPAISFENVGNAAASKESALAPQDVFRPKDNYRRAGVGAEELSPQERRALRRAKKDAGAATKERRQKHIDNVKAQAKRQREAAAE